MTQNIQELFEQAIMFPDPDMSERLSLLVGLDDHKSRLSKLLGLLVNAKGIGDWAKKYHPDAKGLLNFVLRRPPLVVLAGDVGSGKTELATTIGDLVARQEKISITLFPLSLSTRGSGKVGEMTQLIQHSFDFIIEEAKKISNENAKSNGAVILLVDEADALAQSRELSQMNHEDKAGVNAFIRGIDRMGNGKLPAAVIMCTNRINALDPAIRRRASDILVFGRPTKTQRFQVLEGPLSEVGISKEKINKIVQATGKQNGTPYGFTFSDLTQRLLPAAVLDAYPDKNISADRVIEIAHSLKPTPPFKEN
jgi:AAA+ superfamily predicted ATPase